MRDEGVKFHSSLCMCDLVCLYKSLDSKKGTERLVRLFVHRIADRASFHSVQLSGLFDTRPLAGRLSWGWYEG